MPDFSALLESMGAHPDHFQSDTDEYFMALALQSALKAAQSDEVPVGSVIVHQGQVIAVAHNQPIGQCDPTAHAEVVALRKAADHFGNYRLVDCDLFVTVEPCLMCFGAMVHARVRRVVFGASEPRAGVLVSQLSASTLPFFNHKVEYSEGVLAEACSALMKGFFAHKRRT